jgi:hypothetical protein
MYILEDLQSSYGQKKLGCEKITLTKCQVRITIEIDSFTRLSLYVTCLFPPPFLPHNEEGHKLHNSIQNTIAFLKIIVKCKVKNDLVKNINNLETPYKAKRISGVI